jgi:holo-[acyl-carrier protein] synthase
MRIIGHGIDTVSIAEIRDDVDCPDLNWVEQFCSPDERKRAGKTGRQYRYFASCFAGKEAVVKAMGTGFAGAIRWEGIEILRKRGGAPFVRLNGDVKKKADKLGISDCLISITYTDDTATASVIAVGA